MTENQLTRSASDIAAYIDHTLLKPEAQQKAVEKICSEAIDYGFFSVCIQPYFIEQAKRQLEGSQVKICTVIGFPLGVNQTKAKASETALAYNSGADEFDMVINMGALKDRETQFIVDDIAAVVESASTKTVKVIIETSLLTDEEKVLACQLSQKAGAHFVKTSTGFNGGGATIDDVRLMRETVGPEMGVKASGGIRDLESAQAMIAAGATRLGTSSGVAIVSGNQGSGAY